MNSVFIIGRCVMYSTHCFLSPNASIMGFLVFGFSWQYLYFRRLDEKAEEKVFESRTTYPAFRCSECGAIVIQNQACVFPPPPEKPTGTTER